MTTKEKKYRKSMRFALMLNEKTQELFIMVDPGFIYTCIFKEKHPKWQIGCGLAIKNQTKEPDGTINMELGTPHLIYIAPYQKWINQKEIKVTTPNKNKTFQLTPQDIKEIKNLIKQEDKRLKI